MLTKMTQEEFIAILFADCGYNTAAQRCGWIALRYDGRRYPDELTTTERSCVIDLLKREKEGS